MDTGVPFLLTIEFDGGPELLKLATRVHLVARKYGFKPTWLLGVEALKHPTVLEHLARWQRDFEAEVGALLDASRVPPLFDLGHPDSPPPLIDFPDKIMDEKLTWMTDTLAQLLSKRPVSIRTVPAATDERYYAALVKHGYKVDLTVVPHARIGASDFTAYSEKSYLTPQGIFEVPRTVRRRDRGLWQTLLGVPALKSFQLNSGNFAVARRLALQALRTPPDHLDLRIAAQDWQRGEILVRELTRLLPLIQSGVISLSPEELLTRYKNEQLRKGLL